MKVTKEYYTLVDYASSNLVEFINEQMARPDFFEKAKTMYPNLVKQPTDIYILSFDLLRCYIGLGHKINVESKESLGLFLVVYNSNLGNPDKGFAELNTYLSLGRGPFVDFVNSVSSQVEKLPSDYDFLVANILSDLGEPDLRMRYHVLLYRFCSVVAKADHSFSSRESEWLAALLKVSEGNVKSVYDISPDLLVPSEETNPNSKSIESNDKPNKVDEGGASLHDQIASSDAIKQLDSLVGLSGVKNEVHNLTNFALVQIMRRKNGMKTVPLSLHCVFSGNPGTGKTTVARLMGQIFKDIGLLKKGHLVETDRSGLVAQYVGQTAVKTNEVIDSAIDGVLFIDEAYSLVSGAKEDYGAEVISTLLKRMEDQRDEFVVILAGYTENMNEFIASNPGLKSRFSRMISFDDYSPEEILKIYLLQIEKFDYRITEDAKESLLEKIKTDLSSDKKDFGNGRYARNLFEKTLELQANRVAFLPNVDKLTLGTIIREDIDGLL